jgi:hypothetical protein
MKWKILIVLVLIIRGYFDNNCYAKILSGNSETREFDSITKIICRQGNIDTTFIIASKIVLNKYPELENIHIEFVNRDIKTMMAARPTLLSFFKQREKRNYIIIISTNLKNSSKLFFRELSANAKVGIISHEFAHILCYNNQSGFQLLFYGVKYLFNKREIERETDKITIHHGFGKNLIEYVQFVYNSNLVSKSYLDLKKRNYLSINEIKEISDN